MATPTIAIGVGGAGCRMLGKLDDLILKEDDTDLEDDFLYVGIDTNDGDLYDEAPSDTVFQPLEKPDRVNTGYHYVTNDVEIGAEDGSSRQRRLARFYLDQRRNYNNVYNTLRDSISDFTQEHPGHDHFNIWILAALGGGTGSGSFPLISLILREITRQQQEDFVLGGIGSLPRLDAVEDTSQKPARRSQFYVNTYTALTELQALLDESESTVKLENEYIGDEISHYTSVFDLYWLIGFDEREVERREDPGPYRDEMNAIAANAILFHAKRGASENFPETDTHTGTLQSINSVSLGVTIDDVKTYNRLKQEIEALDGIISNLNSERDTHEETIEYLNEIRRLNLAPGDELAEHNLENVSFDLIQSLKQSISGINVTADLEHVEIAGDDVDVEAIEDFLDNEIKSLTETHRGRIRDPMDLVDDGTEKVELNEDEVFKIDTEGNPHEYNKRNVVARLFSQLLYKSLHNEKRDHEFREMVDNLWEQYESKVEEFHPSKLKQHRNDSPIGKWNGVLRETLNDYETKLKEDKEDTLAPWTLHSLNKKLSRLEESTKNIGEYYEQYLLIDTLEDQAVITFNGASRELVGSTQGDSSDSDLERVKTISEQKRQAKEAAERKRGEKIRQQGRLQESLTTYSQSTGRYELALTNVEEFDVDPDATVPEGSIASILDEHLDREHLASTFSDALESEALTTDPVQDLRNRREEPPATVNTGRIIGHLTNSANTSGEGGAPNIFEIELENQQDINQLLDQNFDVNEGRVDTNDPFSIRFVSFFVPIALENTSEFGVMDEYYIDEQKSVSEHLTYANDDDVTHAFAYPELLQGRPEIQDRLQSYYRQE